MSERTEAGAPRARRPNRLRLVVPGVVLALGAVFAVLYGMDRLGKEAGVACPGLEAVTARLDPMAHGELAAFGLSRPARAAPDLSFAGPDGKATSLAALRGRTVLVNFWATWCIPCRTEMPALDGLQAKLGGPDFEVVAINVDTARLDRPRTFLKDVGATHLNFYADPTAGVLQVLKNDGQLVGLPTTMLVGRNGCELGAMAGPADWSSPEAEQFINTAKS